MASSKEYLSFILEQLSETDDISFRPMMGEYIIYCRGKSIGGIYDDRFLIKPSESAVRMIPHAAYEKPYDGAKDMLLVDNLEDKAFLKTLLENISNEVPEHSKRKKAL